MSDWPAGIRIRPLNWIGPQTGRRQSSPFRSSWSSTLALLSTELRLVGARDRVLQIAVTEDKFRNDGLPYANAVFNSPAVILSFTTAYAGALSFPADRFTHWQDNVRAIALGLEALRKVERYGITPNHEQYRGWRAIEGAPAAVTPLTGWAEAQDFICGVIGTPIPTTVGTDWWAFVRRAKRTAHPDTGGDAATFQRVIEAESLLRDGGLL